MDIHADPKGDYQHFINAFKRKNAIGKSQTIVEKGNKLWKELKNDPAKVKEYISSVPVPAKANKQTKPN